MKVLTVFLVTVLLTIGNCAQAANVLVVLSDSHDLQLKNNKVYHTGFYLNELMEPVKLMMDAGNIITFATPEGKAPVMDRHSLNAKDFGGNEITLSNYLRLLKKLDLTNPEHSPVISLARVEQIGYDHYDAVFVPGGHAPMQDLSVSQKMGSLLSAFHKAGKITALVCHGSVALISTLPDAKHYTQRLSADANATDKGWIYAGYKMTGFTNAEENGAKPMYQNGTLRFTLETALEGAGAKFIGGDKWQSHVVQDRELITGQNPASALALGKILVSRLAAIDKQKN